MVSSGPPPPTVAGQGQGLPPVSGATPERLSSSGSAVVIELLGLLPRHVLKAAFNCRNTNSHSPDESNAEIVKRHQVLFPGVGTARSQSLLWGGNGHFCAQCSSVKLQASRCRLVCQQLRLQRDGGRRCVCEPFWQRGRENSENWRPREKEREFMGRVRL